jgi:hypothetical protein
MNGLKIYSLVYLLILVIGGATNWFDSNDPIDLVVVVAVFPIIYYIWNSFSQEECCDILREK